MNGSTGFPNLKTPTNMDIEITSVCNFKCRHCYNFWRHDDSPIDKMTIEVADLIIDQIIENKVFHVVLTGGECMTNYDVLKHFMLRLNHADISFSMNTNLYYATAENMKELYQLGLPHLLTTLNSYDSSVNDKMVSSSGAFQTIVQGIKYAVDAGIRVSANMIVTQLNKEHVYQTGKLLAELGVTNFFTTRMVPSEAACQDLEDELQISPEEEKLYILNEAVRVKQETGIQIGSLIQYPVCFLGDIDLYRDYVGRGCPAGSKMLCVNANGETHACLHEHQGYGNVITDGLLKCWENMKRWRTGELLPLRCKDCEWLEYCEGGCRLYTKRLDGMDLLAPVNNGLLPSVKQMERQYQVFDNTSSYYVPKRLRFRQEDGFYVVSVRGASVYELSNSEADFLMKVQSSTGTFTRDSFPFEDKDLLRLIELWIIESSDQTVKEPVSNRMVLLKT